MKFILFILCFFSVSQFPLAASGPSEPSGMVIATKQISVKGFSSIWNPSIVKIENGFLFTFRYCLAPDYPWISYIGAVLLNDDLEVISKPQLLVTRREGDLTSSQAEDARVFSCDGQIYILYNDNLEVENPIWNHRRDMYLAKITIKGKRVSLEEPLKLFHVDKYQSAKIQKNWVPFDWHGQMLLAYSLNPHEILYPDLNDGKCSQLCLTQDACEWRWGNWRGGTPAVLVDGEYLAFFHSSNFDCTKASNGLTMYHYYMGAYTFSAEPPFGIQSASREPIVAEGFYTNSQCDKRVVFPGGIEVVGSCIYVAYGKDDAEAWVAIIDKNQLKNSMQPINKL